MNKIDKLSRVTVTLIMTILVIMTSAIQSLAVDEDTESKKVIKIACIDYEGFFDKDENGVVEGYGVDLLNEISKYTGWKYQYIFDSFSNQLENLKNGKVDLICHAQKTESREKDYIFSKNSTGSESSVLYGRKGDDRFYYNDYESLDGITIGFMNESFQNDVFASFAESNGFQYNSKMYSTKTETFEALKTGEVDAVAMGSLGGIEGFKVLGFFGSDPFYFMSGKENQSIINSIDTALMQILASNPTFTEGLYKKYYSNKAASESMLFTREEEEYIKNAEAITVGVLKNRTPLSYDNKNGKPAGMIIDLMDMISKKSGLKFTYSFLSEEQTGYDFLSSGEGKLVAGIADSKFSKPNAKLIQSNTLLESSIVFVCQSATHFNTSSKMTIVIPKGFINGKEAISAVYPNFSCYFESSNEDCLIAVRDGKADAMLMNIYTAREYLQSPLYGDLQVFPAYSLEENEIVVSLPENSLLLSIVSKTIESITEDETNEIVVKNTVITGYQPGLKEMIYKYRIPIVHISILVIILFALCIIIAVTRQRNLKIQEKSNKELEKTNAELAVALSQADRVSYAKSEFLSRMSHEIRTPLNAIVGLTQIAKHNEKQTEKIEDCLDKIEASSGVLLNIINDVLDMSAIESNKIKIDHVEFNIKKVLLNILSIYYSQCKEKGITITMDDDIEHEYLIGDSLRLNQILLNLVSNAYKFTEAGGEIHIEANELSNKNDTVFIKFTVSDTGCGMTPEMLTRLFKPFEQENASTAKEFGGSGLGTSIAKNLIDLMHGAIKVESEKGKGTTFIVNLPFQISDQQKTKNNDSDDINKSKHDYDFSGHMVLLAEDQPLNAEIATELLNMVNMKCEHAQNGLLALEMFKKSEPGRYDAILMDLQMPEMDGLKATSAIRMLDRADAKTIPIFAMTANAFNEDVSKALSSGMNGHIAKPIDTAILYEKLYSVINKDKP